MPTQKFFTTKEAAKILGYSLSNVNYLIQDGKLIPAKHYGRNLFSDAELSRFKSLHKSKKS